MDYSTFENDKAVLVYGHDVLTIFSPSNRLNYTDSKKFIEDIPKLFKNVKAVIMNVFDHKPVGFKTNIEFCEAAKAKLNSLNIQNYFYSVKASGAMLCMIMANITVKFNETVLITFSRENTVAINEYEFTENGYKLIDEKNFTVDLKENPRIIRDKIIGSSNPKKMILMSDNVTKNAYLKYLRIAMKSKKLFVFEQLISFQNEKYIEESSKWLLDKSFIKWHITPTCSRNFVLATDFGAKLFPLNSPHGNEYLPFRKSVYLSKIDGKEAQLFTDENRISATKLVETFLMEQRCHRNKFTFTIDGENFPKIKQELFISSKIMEMPKKLDENVQTKIPIIGFLDNFSVICICKENGGYKFMESWNDFYGKENIISFEEEKPKYFDDALKVYFERTSSVVYDLTKIMSMPSDKIEINNYWGFKITKDSENPILLEFENFDGMKKAASPSFFMAMILKEQLRAIKNEIGEKPPSIGLYIADKFNSDEKSRVEKELQKSCDLLKIECIFVNL
uniref:Uncharacterized protein n=1 Tax=Panagrolaimus sp. ES5 TaxID=591445 RepID=A0AC34F4P2_9BILA